MRATAPPCVSSSTLTRPHMAWPAWPWTLYSFLGACIASQKANHGPGGALGVALKGTKQREERPTYVAAALTWDQACEVVVCGLACMDIAQRLEAFPEPDAKAGSERSGDSRDRPCEAS